jgi:hypothetical protein
VSPVRLIGPHKITNVSVEEPLVDEMLRGERVNVLYSDPPWGGGNLSYWVTMNRKMSGREYKALTFEALIARFAELIGRYVDGHVMIETGLRWEDQVKEQLAPVVKRPRSFRLVYGKGTENVLIAGVTRPDLPDMPFDPSGMHGAAVSRDCVASVAVPGGIVLDPCCGMGYSARAAIAAQMKFRGNEFNPVRLQKTIDFLQLEAAR